MYDATGKQGAGLFLGALTWKGNFQECLNTLEYQSATIFATDEDSRPAQYCSVFLQTPTWLVQSAKSLVRASLPRVYNTLGPPSSHN